MSTVWDKVKDANRAIAPEESIAVRVAVAFTVLVAVAALLQEGLVGPGVAAAALIGIPIGFVGSWMYRASDALLWKAFLAVALITAVVVFFGDLVASAQQGFVNVQLPLAELFLWVQVIHSLHVPARRDLMFSVTSSGVMLAITAASSISLTIGPFLAVWAVGLVVSLMLAYRSSIRDLPQLSGTDNDGDEPLTRGLPKRAATGLLVMGIIGAVVFGMVPAAQVSRAFTFPVSLPDSLPLGTPGSLSNPSLGEGGDAGADAGEGGFGGRSSFGYFGFAEQLDTSLRGRPDDTLVMRVRAPAPAFWRGQTFDTWDGQTWTNSDDTEATIGGGPPIQVRPTVGVTSTPGEEFVQTFYLEERGPNVIFGAYRMTDIYFGDRFLFEMTDGTVLAGVDLDPGTVYTVISSRPQVDADLLRAADSFSSIPDDVAARYLQVPSGTPDRVVELASRLTRNESNTYDKVKAIEAWMGANTTYTLDIPPLAAGEDTVDQFLFETRQGFCEQIGTSLVVMLRSQGIPARLVVGFTPGERNPFTGLFEVRADNAHSWAEVWFPGVGWQGFDPTAHVPLSADADLGSASDGVSDYLTSRLSFLAALGGGLVVTLGVVVFVGAMIVLGRQIWLTRQERLARSWTEVLLDRIEQAGAARGRPRAPHETTREYTSVLADTTMPDDRWDQVVDTISAGEIGGETISAADRSKVEQTLNQIIERYPAPLKDRLLAGAGAIGPIRAEDRT